MIGLAGCALLLVNVIMAAARSRRYSATSRKFLFLVITIAAFVPVGGLSIAGYLRGVTGDVSVTTLVLLVAASIACLFDKNAYTPRSFSVLMLLVLGGGLSLYPFALGFTYFDSYALGYGSKAFIAVLFLLTLGAWYFERYLIVVCLVLAVWAYIIGMYESRNLWDYLIDPMITLYALVWLVAEGIPRFGHLSSCDAQYRLTQEVRAR